MPPLLEPAAGPLASPAGESSALPTYATSSPRRVEDAPPARWRGPKQASANSRPDDADFRLRVEIAASTRSGPEDEGHTSGPFPAAEAAARVADARGSVSIEQNTKARRGQDDGEGSPANAEPQSYSPPPATASARVGDERGPAGTIWQDDAFLRDAWVRAVEGEPLPDAPAILPKTRWLAERTALAGRNAPLGLYLDAGDRIDDIAADLAHFSLIALAFPKFSDGRAFSTARLLRDKYGYTGELRAVGNVLSDQIPFMRRVGFDAFEVRHAPTRRALRQGRIPEVTLHYQPARADEPPTGTRPWLRRRGR